MDVGRHLVEPHLKEGHSMASLARDHGLHPSWIHNASGLSLLEVGEQLGFCVSS